MLGSYAKNNDRISQSDDDMNLDSESNRSQQNSNLVGEDFRSLLNTNSTKNSEMTIKTTRMISVVIENQVTRRLNDIKSILNSQIQDAIETAITDKILPSIQNALGMQGRQNFTMVDQRSIWRHRSPVASTSPKLWKTSPKPILTPTIKVMRLGKAHETPMK